MMPEYFVQGVTRDTGRSRMRHIKAPDEQTAYQRAAELGIVVSKLERLGSTDEYDDRRDRERDADPYGLEATRAQLKAEDDARKPATPTGPLHPLQRWGVAGTLIGITLTLGVIFTSGDSVGDWEFAFGIAGVVWIALGLILAVIGQALRH